MTFVTLAASAVLLGFLHGLGADHLMAIAALSIDGRGDDRRHSRVLRTAVGFAAGHAILLGLGATAALLFGWVLPAAAESGAEALGGVLLIGLGGAGLWTVLSGRTYGHIHPVDETDRWHLHLTATGGHPTGQHAAASNLPTLMGAVFAVSSLRALMLLAPFGGDVRSFSLPVVLLLVVLFGVGILLSMSLFGVVLARVLSLKVVEHLGRAAAVLVALASIVLGAYWVL
ncbi:MAG: hypothetical protein R2752_14835 [Vicinamibacterales bacterium]